MQSVNRNAVTLALAAEIFLIFFQGYFIAPLVPRLAEVFSVPVERAGLLVAAYTVPYGFICLVVGPLADRLGTAKLLRWLVGLGALVPLLNALATTFESLLVARIFSGIALGGIAPVALALIARMFPYAERGRPVGWFFGAIAGGMALGATAGPWLEPRLHWQGLFVLVAVLNVPVFVALSSTLRIWADEPSSAQTDLARTYVSLATTRRGGTAYAFVFFNGAFHSGVFSWLGVYFTQHYQLTSAQLAGALLGYGLPGILLGPVFGKAADRFGRRWLIRGGILLSACCALVLASTPPLWVAQVAVVLLSVGLDASHPLLSGIVSSLDAQRTAQAMALNTFMVFVGFGLGSAAFGTVFASLGIPYALTIFGGLQLFLVLVSFALFEQVQLDPRKELTT